MYISLSTLVAFALPFGITAERYIVTCGDSKMACSPWVLKDLEDAGATVIENFPFGVAVVDADEDFNPVVSNVAISLDLEMQLEQTEDVAAILSDLPPYQGNVIYPYPLPLNKDERGGGRRLQMKSPPFSGDDGKCITRICKQTFLSFLMVHCRFIHASHYFVLSLINCL
jgi:hypothetical protein